MSQRAQIAFGRNHTLQKQLEHQYLNIRQRFKHSRRRQDIFEEECVDSLYKMMLYAKYKQQTDSPDVEFEDVGDASSEKPSESARQTSKSRAKTAPKERTRPHSVFEVVDKRAEDALSEEIKRPMTAMSSKTYKQSYSFKKYGLNIDRNRRDRYLLKKKHIQTVKDMKDEFRFEKTTTKDKLDIEEEVYQASVEKEKDSANGKNTLAVDRPKTALSDAGRHSESSKLLSRRTNTVNSRSLSVEPSVASDHTRPSPAVTPVPGRGTSPLPHGSGRQDGPTAKSHGDHNGILKPVSASRRENMALTPRTTVHEGRVKISESSPMSVKITRTRISDDSDDITDGKMMGNTNQRAESRMDNVEEEELLPLSEDDLKQLDTLTVNNGGYNSRMETRSVMLASRQSAPDNYLDRSISNTKSFLNTYSKKSKIFGYVVKTRASTTAQRERTKSYRSPNITYQELVSIKANIRQHESRTKSLLQRSAKLSIYVDKLATANRMRAHIQGIKDAKNSGR